MESLGGLVGMATLLFSLLRFMLGIWLLTAPLPKREHFGRRLACVFAGTLALYVATAYLFLRALAFTNGAAYIFGQLATYSLLLLGFVASVVVLYDTNLWTALLCCSAGYALENFASGAVELVWSLRTGHSVAGAALVDPSHVGVAFGCMVATYGVFYLLVSRRMQAEGLEQVDDHKTLVVFAVVVCVIIGFDILIKWLVNEGLSPAAVLLLRGFHGLSCIFTLYVEFELLVRRRLEAERDALQRVVAERERAYEASRENVAVINAQVHDIRHAIGRLAEGAQVERSVLAKIVREVDVYDASIHTGSLPLDTALAERQLAFRRDGVAFTYIADGSGLGFMGAGDVFALFGSLLDAALAWTLTREEGRSVSLSVRPAFGTLAVHVEATGSAGAGALNAAGGAVAKQLDEAQRICERYDAALGHTVAGNTLQADILFVG